MVRPVASGSQLLKEGVAIEIRPAISTDAPFILSSWLWSYVGSAFANRIDRRTFFAGHHEYATRLIGRGAVVAVLPDQRDVIIGFLVGAGEVLHYVYVKGRFWRMGIASEMMHHVYGDKPVNYSHEPTVTGLAFIRRFRARYNPYM